MKLQPPARQPRLNRHLLYVLLLALGCSAGACARTPAQTPAPTAADGAAESAERLHAEVPDGWFKGVDSQAGELTIEEYFPPGTEDYWAQKVVFESLSGADLPDPIVYLDGLAEQQQQRCEEFSHHNVFAGFENGYPTVVRVLQCGLAKLTGKPVITVIKAIKGNRALYTISRVWRLETPAAGQDLMPPGNMAELAAWSNTLQRIQACDPGLAAHPCTDHAD